MLRENARQKLTLLNYSYHQYGGHTMASQLFETDIFGEFDCNQLKSLAEITFKWSMIENLNNYLKNLQIFHKKLFDAS